MKTREIPLLTKIAYPKKRKVLIRSYDLQLYSSGTKYILGKPLVNKYQLSSKSRALEGPGMSKFYDFIITYPLHLGVSNSVFPNFDLTLSLLV